MPSFLLRLEPPRPSFPFDATAAETALFAATAPGCRRPRHPGAGRFRRQGAPVPFLILRPQ